MGELDVSAHRVLSALRILLPRWPSGAPPVQQPPAQAVPSAAPTGRRGRPHAQGSGRRGGQKGPHPSGPASVRLSWRERCPGLKAGSWVTLDKLVNLSECLFSSTER